jgi:hypothetical protein
VPFDWGNSAGHLLSWNRRGIMRIIVDYLKGMSALGFGLLRGSDDERINISISTLKK